MSKSNSKTALSRFTPLAESMVIIMKHFTMGLSWRCISNRFDIADERRVWQGYLFEGGIIELRFETVTPYLIRDPL